ncbi:MAG: hypothetical protein ACPG4U_07115, partial [Pseudomonadales bacterium]
MSVRSLLSRIALAFTLLVLATILLLYLFTPQLASYALTHWLSERGIQAQLQLSHPGSDRLRIEQLTLLNAAPQLEEIRVQGVDIRFDLLTLLHSQRVSDVSIEQLSLQLNASSESSSEQALELATLLPSELLAQLPIAKLQIQQLTAQLKTALFTAQFKGELTLDPTALKASVSYTEPNQPDSALAITLKADNALEFSLSRPDQFNYQLRGQLTKAQERLAFRGTQRLRISDYSLLHSPWMPVELPADILSLLAPVSLQLRDELQLSLPLRIDAGSALLDQLAIEQQLFINAYYHKVPPVLARQNASLGSSALHLSAHNTLQAGKLEVRLAPGSQLQLNEFSHRALTTDNASLTLDKPVALTLIPGAAPTLSSDIALSVRWAPLTLGMGQLSAKGLTIHIPAMASVDKFKAQLQLDQLTFTPNSAFLARLPATFEQLTTSLTAGIQKTSDGFSLELVPQTLLSLHALRHPQLASAHLALTLNRALQATITEQGELKKVANAELTLHSAPWQSSVGDMSASPAKFSVTALDLAEKNIDFTLALNSLALTPKSNTVKHAALTNLEAQVSLSP